MASMRWVPRLRSRRSRRLATAVVATLGIGATVLAVAVGMRWQATHAVKDDTRVVLNQAADQLLRTFQSRRGTLTLLRDTLDRAPDLNVAEQQALGNSAAAHTRHLLGVGVLRSGHTPEWLKTPSAIPARERAQLDRVIGQQIRLRGRRTPGTWMVEAGQQCLVMLEPMRAKANRGIVLVGVFDLAPLLKDFFELSLQQPYPVQLLSGDAVLYRSTQWPASSPDKPLPILEHPIRLDAIQWTLQMRPGHTGAAKTISTFAIALIVLGALAGLTLIGLIWLMAMRTWILQRAVVRRTAALRRTLARVRQLAVTDELTGLYNRRYFLERWQWEYERARRYNRELSCLMIDVDGFKQVNDYLGHDAGDLALKRVAAELRRHLRQADILARFGGDEFIVALPETSFEQAAAVAEKLRSGTIQGTWTDHPNVGAVRMSVGVGHVHEDLSSGQILQQADKALYDSRRARRRKRAADSPHEPISSAS